MSMEAAITARERSKKPAGYPVTPDGRYFVVRGRLWRMSDPQLTGEVRQALVDDLMRARREIASSDTSMAIVSRQCRPIASENPPL